MKRIFKWVAIIIVSIALLAAILAFYFTNKYNKAFEKDFAVNVAEVVIPTDSASLERGRVLTVGCRTCHGVDYSGVAFFDDPTIGRVISSNLTRAKGSQTENYTDIDFVRAMRHGLNPNGNPLMIMPSEAFTHYSDQDLGCLIAFLKSLPKIENQLPTTELKPFAKILAGAGQLGEMFPANIIDHAAAANIPHVPLENTLAFGEYLSRIEGCKTCHGKDFGGGISPDPISPPVPNITTGANFGKWNLEQFTSIFRTGTTPEGKVLDGRFMPFAGLGAFSDAEIASLYEYIKSMPAITPEVK